MTAAASAVAAGLSVAMLILGVGKMATRQAPAHRPPHSRVRRRGPGVVARYRHGRLLAERLRRAGIRLDAGMFVTCVAVCAGIAAVSPILLLGMPLLAPAAAGAVILAAAAVVRSADRRHVDRVAAQLPQVSHQLAAALAAGLSLRQALTRAARDAPDPIAGELRGAVDELELGARIETALEGLAARVPARDVRVMVTAILVQRRTGGNLARALASLADRLEERSRLARELKGATAQARMTAWLVAALPLAAGVMAEVAAPGTLQGALGQAPGPALLAVSAGMYAIGVVWVRRIGSVPP